MKVILWLVGIYIVVMIGLSFDKKQVEAPIEEIPMDVTPMVEEAIVPQSKYSFIVIVTDEPVEFSVRENKQYTTEIDTIDSNINEDYRYIELDLAEKNLRIAELDSIQSYYNAEVKVVKRNFLVFDTYKEASLARQEFLQKN